MGFNWSSSAGKTHGGEKFFDLMSISNGKSVVLVPAALSSMSSVCLAAKKIKEQFASCTYLFNCAGAQYLDRRITEDGYERMFASNYLGHFLLTNLPYD